MSDFQVLKEQAQARLPLRRLIEQYHDDPKNGHWKRFPKCPFCGSDAAGLHTHTKRGGGERFKCFHSDCPTGGQSLDEIGYLAQKTGLDNKSAAVEYLKMAGVWKESTPAPSVLPGQKRRKNPLPKNLPGEKTNLPPKEPESPNSDSCVERVENGSPDSDSPPGAAENSTEPGASMDPEVAGVAAGDVRADGNPIPEEVSGGSSDAERVKSPGGGAASPPAGAALSDGSGAPPDKIVPFPGGGGGGGGDDEPPKTLKEQALECLRHFYGQLRWSKEDEEECWRKRGLTPVECAAAGFRTNDRGNEKILLALSEKFPEEVLLESGLWLEREGRLFPNEQFYGYGLVGKKPKEQRRHEKDKTIWDWKESGKCNPILIPYFDATGQVEHLRPHKGGIAGRPARPYIARSLGQPEVKFRAAFITEGEFKARALKQVFGWKGGHLAIAAMPGIQMAKNYQVLEELKAWLMDMQVDSITIGYDNEEKGDPHLPGFQADKRRRFDSAIWARYLAEVLAADFDRVRVCTIPNEWRNARGKADWDGVLAAQVSDAAGLALQPDAAWGECADAVQRRWIEVVQKARTISDLRQPEMFGSEAERIISNALENLRYKKALDHGDDKEWSFVTRLRKLAKTRLKDGVPVAMGKIEVLELNAYQAHGLADAYKGIIGWYYDCKAPQAETLEKWAKARRALLQKREYELAWFMEMRMRGLPVRVANFKMTCKYVLVRADGKRDRLVLMRNDRGEMTRILVPLDAFSQSSSTHFREWAPNQGNYVWKGNQTQLDNMIQDITHESAYLDVFQIVAFGTDDRSGLWFFGDSALPGDGGREVIPDRDGIFWWDDASGTHLGYQISAQGSDGQDYRQAKGKAPRMQPYRELAMVEGEFKLVNTLELNGEQDKLRADVAPLRALFENLSLAMFETLGGYEGFLALGMMLAYGAAPEIYAREDAFPGLWLSGEKGHGKNTVCTMLMEMWGFNDIGSGIGLQKSSTPVGIQIAAEQYANLPVWLDEYSETEVDAEKKSIVHASFGRENPSKWSATGQMRKSRTAFLISGETSASKASTRQRFPHIEVARSKRKGSHLPWLKEHRKFFFSIGRHVLRNRPDFVKRVLTHMETWMALPAMAKVEERSRLVHGVGYAAFAAFADMVGAIYSKPKAKDLSILEYQKALINLTVINAGEVQDQVNVNEFLRQLYEAWQNEAFGHGASEWKRYFKAIRRGSETHSPGNPAQTEYPWETIHFYFKPGPVIAKMREYLRRQGITMPLSQADLKAQMQTRAFFVTKGARNGWHKQRFHGSKEAENCWCINLDQCEEMGYRPVSDEVWKESIYKDGVVGKHWESYEFNDPRKGDLFALVKALENEQPEMA